MCPSFWAPMQNTASGGPPGISRRVLPCEQPGGRQPSAGDYQAKLVTPPEQCRGWCKGHIDRRNFPRMHGLRVEERVFRSPGPGPFLIQLAEGNFQPTRCDPVTSISIGTFKPHIPPLAPEFDAYEEIDVAAILQLKP